MIFCAIIVILLSDLLRSVTVNVRRFMNTYKFETDVENK